MEKAFDSVQIQTILASLQEHGIEYVYIEILKYIYTDSSVRVHLHKEIEKIRINRVVRQGDTISRKQAKLFTATLESIFRRLNWENKAVKTDGPNSALLMTFSYAQKHHKNYNRCYKNYPMRAVEWIHRKDKGDGCRHHPYKRV